MISCFQNAISSIRGALILRFDLQLHGCDFGGNQTWQGKLNQPHCAEFLTWQRDNESTWKALYAKCPLIPENPEKKHGYCTQFPISHIYSSEVPSIVWSNCRVYMFRIGVQNCSLPSLRRHCPVCKWGGDGKSKEICRSFVPLIRWCIATRTSSTFKVWRMISQGVRWTLGLGS